MSILHKHRDRGGLAITAQPMMHRLLVPLAVLMAAPGMGSAQVTPTRALIVKPAGAPASSNVAQIRAYLDGLPPLVTVRPNPGHPEAMVGLPVGISGKRWVGEEVVNTQAELALLKSFANVTWPGALVQGATIDNNNFAPFGSVERSGGRIRLATEFTGAAHVSQYTDLPVVSAGAVDDARRRMIQAVAPTGSVGTLVWSFETGETLREAMVKLGVEYEGSGVSASLNARLNSHYGEHTVVAKLTQVFYRVAFDLLGDSPFFAPSVTLADVQRYAGPRNPPLYVSEIKYGRILLVEFTGTLDTLDLEAGAMAAYSGFKGNAGAAYKQKLSSARMEVLSVGGRADPLVGLVVVNNPDAMAKTLQAAVQSGIKYDPQNNPGDAIGITMNYVSSNQVAIAQMLTQTSPKVIDLTTVRVCLDTLRNADRRGPFQVWDGPGGGPVNTGISVMPGDEVTFEARGTNWSGVIATGDYGPDGWHTWDRPKDGELGYPITDRSPFALIARFGAGNNKGPDRSKPDYREGTSGAKAPSDWFFVGTSQTAVVEQVNPQSGQGWKGYGDIYLGTNDNNPFNGDPSKRFTVRVCVKRDPKNLPALNP